LWRYNGFEQSIIEDEDEAKERSIEKNDENRKEQFWEEQNQKKSKNDVW
jgi:hypothetical protein